jgi:hypothetical protein
MDNQIEGSQLMRVHNGARPNGEQPTSVPVFTCLVYLSHEPSGGVRARAANLADLEYTAASEREALAKLIPAFKQRVGEFLGNGATIPWIEPTPPAAPGEQVRFVPVHL